MLEIYGRKIEIYHMKIEDGCSKEQSSFLYNMLPKERQESVDRARNDNIARKRLYTGAFLQYVLSKETGIPVENLRYRYNQWGKPELDVACMKGKEPLHFNLSHSGEYVAVAVSDCPIGVDVEHKVRNYESIAKRCFCKEEYEDIMSLESERQREQRFLEYWTMKEAYVKYVGKGLQIPLNSFRIERGESYSKISDVVGGTFFSDAGYCFSFCCEKSVWGPDWKMEEVMTEISFFEMFKA